MSKIEITLPCSPETAFRLWTDAGEIQRWWGDPAKYRTMNWSSELRPNGAWRAEFETLGGQRFGAAGKYLVVVSARRLEWTWQPDWDPASLNLLRMTFDPHPQGTKLTVITEGFKNDAERLEGEPGSVQILGWFERYLANTASPAIAAPRTPV